MKNRRYALLALLLALCLLFASGCLGEGTFPNLPGTGGSTGDIGGTTGGTPGTWEGYVPPISSGTGELQNPGANPNPLDPATLPAYSGAPYVAVQNNLPAFTADQLVSTSFEYLPFRIPMISSFAISASSSSVHFSMRCFSSISPRSSVKTISPL